MIKTIEISGRDVQFDTSLSWMLLYRTQFGSDPIDIVMPAIKAAIPLFNRAGEEFTEADYDLLTDVLSEISLTEGLQLIWSLARNADRKIDDPANWYHGFENFPLDDVLSELDGNRQRDLLESIHGIQTLITCAGDYRSIEKYVKIDRMFEVHGGVCHERKI